LSYELGFIDGDKITSIRKLSNEEFQEYKRASDCLSNFSNTQQLYTITLLNYNEYFTTLKEYEQQYSSSQSLNSLILERMFLNINRRLLNYLSSIRSFLDHTETRLKEKYGKEFARVKHFLEACSKEYENSFSYKFFYTLRNFTQHFGMPVGSLRLTSTEDPPYSGKVSHHLEVTFDRDELLKYNGWKRMLKEEIQRLPQEFDISSHVFNMMKCLERINGVLVKDELLDIVKSAEYIDKLMASIKEKQVYPIVLQISQGNKPSEKTLTYFNIPFHIVQYALNLRNTITQ
jgi:hypothetical protein